MYKLLLVEDEVLVRENICENIEWEKIGIQLVSACKNGKEAIEIIKTQVPDIVLTDICMPYVDGIQLSNYLFDNHPEVKIIILSGYDTFEYAKKAIDYKVEHYLLKPITISELQHVLIELKCKLITQREEQNKVSKIKNCYFKYIKNVQDNILNNILLGNELPQNYKQELEEANIRFTKKYFQVAVIETPDCVLSSLQTFSINNIVNEIITNQEKGFVCQEKTNKTVIILHTDTQEEYRQQTKKILKSIQEQIVHYLAINTVIGVGNRVSRINQIYQSYGEACRAATYSYTCGTNCILDYSYIYNHKGNINIASWIEKIVEQLKRQNDIGIIQEMNKLLEEVKNKYLDKENICLMIQRMLLEIQEVIKLTDLPQEVSEEECIQQFREKTKVEDSFSVIEKYLTIKIKKLGTLQEDTHETYALLAQDYIEKNYYKSEISLRDVCKYLCISTSYFSAIFKKYTGETFIETLTKKRIEKAKYLLTYTNFKNYEIAEKVGFSDPHYFSQTFKKYTGKSPKKYARESRG